jgi:glycosyltransferase involved in cell wall biosynthesis
MWEYESSKDLHIPWDNKVYCPLDSTESKPIIKYNKKINIYDLNNSTKKFYYWFKHRIDYFSWLKSQEAAYDIFILRYISYDPFQLEFAKKCSRKVCFVHHTLEVEELKTTQNIKNIFLPHAENFIGKRTLSAADALIGVTPEIAKYELHRSGKPNQKIFIYPNGVKYKHHKVPDNRTETIQLLFVASFFSSWHGLDILLDNFKNSQENFVFHLVGELSEKDQHVAQQDNRIVLHGNLSQDELHKISSYCHIGLSSFSLARKKMREACTLKTREYLMLGLPVYSGHDDIFPDDFKFYHKGPPIINRILEFAIKFKNVDKKDVSMQSKQYLDKTILLEKLYTEISAYFS